MDLGVGERGVLLGVGRQHLRLVAVGVRGGEVTAQRGRDVEVADLVDAGCPARSGRRGSPPCRTGWLQEQCPSPDPRADACEVEAAHLGRVDRAAVDAAEHVPGQRPGRRRLVGDRRPRRGRRTPRAGRARGGEALAVERVRRGVPRRQLGRVQVPALVVAVLEAPAHQAVVVGPGRPMSSAPPTGRMLVEPSDEPDAGAGHGGLHDQLGVVGDRVLERLVRRRDADERRVVVGAVVQPGQPAPRPRAPSARPAPCRPGRGSTAASRPGPRTAGPASRPRAPSPRPGRRWSPWQRDDPAVGRAAGLVRASRRTR